MGAENFSNGSGNRGRSRIPENLFYNSIPIIRSKVCENVNKGKKQCASRYYCDMILKSAFIIARVEILTRIAKYFFGMRTIIFNCNYFHRKLFVVKISSVIIPMLKSRNLQFVFNEYYPIYNFHYCRKASISKEAACVRRSHINLLRETKKRGKRRDDGWLLTQLRACDPRPTIFYSRATSDPGVFRFEGVVARG